MNKKIIYSILITAIALLAYQTYRLYALEQSQIRLAPSLSLEKIRFSRDSIQYIKNTEVYCMNEGFETRNPVMYKGNDSLRTAKLMGPKSKPILIFRFSGDYCDNCVSFIAKKLKDNFPDFEGNERIVLIGTEINPRSKDDFYGKKIFSYKSDSMGLPFEDYKVPFLFVLDENHACKLLFIPDSDKPEVTESYLRIVKHRFF